MTALLLAIIYLAFISLGLPDSLLGSAWPVMQMELDAPLSSVGILTMIISGGTILSSLLSDRVIHRFGTGLVTAISVAMTALALFGYSLAGKFWVLCLLSIPYGLGAGAVDAALNNYVALHFSSRHMSWLHAFWGVGVTISPNIMSYCLARQYGWNMGYRTVSIIQISLTAILFIALPLWKIMNSGEKRESVKSNVLTIPQALKIRGVPFILTAFFAFCAMEATAGLWASSYLVVHRGVGVETAARFASLFFMGEMVGRFINGFIADKFGDRSMIRVGIIIMISGIAMIMLPLETDSIALAGLLVTGLGSAPVYPCIIHSTPLNFGEANSQSLVGIQMACAYLGSTLMPPIFGLIGEHIDISFYPYYLAIFALLALFSTETLNRKVTIPTRAVGK